MEPKMIEYIVTALAVLASLVQISPLKINPWSWLGRTIGRAINGEVVDRLTAIEKRQATAEDKMDLSNAVMHRYRILRFGDEIKNHVKHSEEMYNQVLEDITDYERYCREHPEFKNGKTVITIGVIEQTYKSCLQNNTFL